MKVIFANPPYIKDDNSSPENNFKIRHFIFRHEYRKIPYGEKLYFFIRRLFGIGTKVRYGIRAGSRWPSTMNQPFGGPPYPFFMGYAASYLKSHGISVNILDSIVEEEYSYQKFLEEIKNECADIVVLETSTPTLEIDLWFAKKVARFTDVALAGPHLNKDTVRDVQKECPEIKYFLLGEYVKSSLEMAKTRKPGIYESEVIRDLDSIDFPFRDYRNAAEYFDPSMPTSKPQLQIYGSKGCPFKCTFCAWPQTMYFGIVSLRKPQKIAEEIRQAVSKHGYKSIFFDDDTFNIGNDRISKLCDYLKEIGIPWTMMGRLDSSPNWLFDKMIDSGCVGMRFGVETFDIGILARVQKGLERTDFQATLTHLSNKYPKVMLHLTMMRDMPGMSEKIQENDMKILKDLGFSEKNIFRSYQLSRCAPFPGTKLFEEMKKELGEEVLKNFNAYDGAQTTVMKQS
ncbi:MAG: hypothetical protein HQM08_15820 [Candidatus Riflebacteria bacterium]|nr:hypothetical protein [Candidatus Riflebacteria bacterium]